MSSYSTGKNELGLPCNQFTVAITCHWCGHEGLSLWEEFNGERHLVSLKGFYERLARKNPYPIEMVCNNCDKVQPI